MYLKAVDAVGLAKTQELLLLLDAKPSDLAMDKLTIRGDLMQRLHPWMLKILGEAVARGERLIKLGYSSFSVKAM